jgi:hypothetical protein
MGHRNVEQKEKIAREVVIPETITIQELANRMSERGVDVIKLLMRQGEMHKITDVIDADTAQLVAEELGHTVKRVAESDVEEGLFDTPDTADQLVSRPATRRSRPCAPAAPRSRISWCWWWRPTTGSCPRRSRPSRTPRRRAFR